MGVTAWRAEGSRWLEPPLEPDKVCVHVCMHACGVGAVP